MQLALISDIHGNLPAFQAVLDRIDNEGVDAILCLGDTVGYGPFPSECIDLMIERAIPSVMGNHDAYLVGRLNDSFFNEPNRRLLRWTREHLRADQMAWLEGLPMVVDHRALSIDHRALSIDHRSLSIDHRSLIIEHRASSVDSSLENDSEWQNKGAMSMLDAQCSMINVSFIAAHASPIDPEKWQWLDSAITCREVLAQLPYDFVFVGHTHVPALVPSELGVFSLEKGYKFLINPGSVGQSRDHDQRASFGILDLEQFTYQHIRLQYDKAPLFSAFERLGYSELDIRKLMNF